jgi:hypothetical protein
VPERRQAPRPHVVTADAALDPPPPEDGRDARLRELYWQGLTLEQIGNELHVTRARVGQLLEDLGLPRDGRSERRVAWLLEHRGDEIVLAFLRLRDDAKVASELGHTTREVTAVVDALVPDAHVLRRRPYKVQPNYVDSELIDSLRAAAAVLPSPLSHDDYNEWAARNPMPDGRPRPGHQTMGLRWGSWRAAVKKAGLPTRPRLGPKSVLSRQTVIAAVVACWRDLGKAPTVAEYEQWAMGHADRPGSASARKFVDGWDDARVSAWEIVHGITLPRTDLPELPANEPDPEDPADVQDVFVDHSAGATSSAADPTLPDGAPTDRAGVPYRQADEDADPAAAGLVAPDPAAVRAALQAHARLQNALADAAAAAGLQPLSPDGAPRYDIAWRRRDDRLMLCEVKSADPDRLEAQMRAALAQALRYQAEAEHRLDEPVDAGILIELEPDALWQALCRRLEITLAWPPHLDRLVGLAPAD